MSGYDRKSLARALTDLDAAELRAALWELLVAVEGYDDHLLGLMDIVDSRYARCIKRAEAAIDHARAALAAAEGQP